MATCKQCGIEYSVWSAALGTGLCNSCYKTQKQERTEAAKKAQDEADKRYEAQLEAASGCDESTVPECSDIIAVLTRRYSDAYTEAHAVVSVGNIFKGIALVLGIIILIGGSVMASSGGSGYFNVMVAGIGFALTCLVGIPIYILGILVAAQGQIQLATLDTAVNNSRHLQDDDVARILSKKLRL